jgi:NAD(P) transhydrogenase
MTYDFDFVAIGSGPAGQRAAVQAAKLGKRAAVVERRRCVGGVCVDTGTIPSKTLREAVIAYAAIAGHGDRGPAARREERPTSVQLLAGIDRVVAREIEIIEEQAARVSYPGVSGTGQGSRVRASA